MKKVFFAFVVTSMVVLTACNNKPKEDATATPAVDTTALKATAPAAAPADTTAKAADTTTTTTTTTTTK